MTIHIPKGLDAPTKDGAWSFIQYLTRPESQRRFTLLSSSPAPHQNILTPEITKERPELVPINEAAVGAEQITPMEQAVRSNYNEFASIIQRAGLKVIATKEPVATILRDAQQELERAVPLK